MAGFSYQQYHPFLVDSAFLLNINTPPPSLPSQFQLHQELTSFNVTTNQDNTSCANDQSSKITISDNEPSSVTKNLSPQSSTVVDKKLETGEQVTQKKRRTRNIGPSLSKNPQSKVNKI